MGLEDFRVLLQRTIRLIFLPPAMPGATIDLPYRQRNLNNFNQQNLLIAIDQNS